MKAVEITDATIKAIENESFKFGRVNYANGDMVGHTGHFDATSPRSNAWIVKLVDLPKRSPPVAVL